MNPAETLACIAATREMTRALRTAERGWDWGSHGRRVAGDREDAALRAAQLGQRLMALSGRRSYDPATVRPMGLTDYGRFVASHQIGTASSAN